MFKKPAAALAAVLLLVTGPAAALEEAKITAGAERPYNYTVWGESAAAPYAYLPAGLVTGADAGTTAFDKPADLYVRDGEVYVLDGKNGRVAVLDASLKLTREIRPAYEKGLADAAGLFVDKDKRLYIALPEQQAVLITDDKGAVIRSVGKPVSPLVPKDMTYKPKKAAVGADGNLYVAAEGVYYGMTVFSPEGEFLRFYGSNQVNASLKTFLLSLLDVFLTAEQKSKTERSLPAEYAAIDADEEGFLYSVTTLNAAADGQVKKHSPDGGNILPRKSEGGFFTASVKTGVGNYGDLETSLAAGTVVTSVLSDIAVDEEGFLFVLDTQRDKVFTYDQDNTLIGVMGAQGTAFGALKEPVALDTLGDDCLVLDAYSGGLLVFRPTDYGGGLRRAVTLYADQQYEQAEALWEEIREQNNNLEIVYDGIGKSALGRGDYEKAMACFSIAQDKHGYNQAFSARRNQIIQKVFPFLFVGLLAVLILVWVAVTRKVKRSAAAEEIRVPRGKLTPAYTLFKPFAGYELIKSEHKGSLLYATLLLAAVFVLRLVSIRYTGFLFNDRRLETVNLAFEFLQVALLFLVWIVSSWAVASFIEGEGFFREIYIACAYALTPYACSLLLAVLLSNVLSLEESVLLTAVQSIGIYWSALLMFVGLMKVHRYSFRKTVLSLLLSAVAILFLLFIGVLAYSLVGQLASFLQDIVREIGFRIQ